MNFSKKNHEKLNGNRRNASKTAIKIFICFTTAIALMAITSCQKDNLEDAVLPQTAQGEQGNSGTDGQNGQNGQDGVAGAQGENGEPGAQGEPGANGTDGQDGADGAPGPAGEQGEPGTDGQDGAQGPVGLRGEQGEQGPAGEDSNANVIASTWIPSPYPDRSIISASHPHFDERLTSEVINNSVILTYARLGGGSTPFRYIEQLPIEHGERYFYTRAAIGAILFQCSITGDTAQNFNVFDAFKYVVIPHGTAAKTARPNFDKMSYEEVMDHFGLTY